MAYVAARGGEDAIQHAEAFFHALGGSFDGQFVRAIERHLAYLVDRVMGEASLYAPDLAALALAQTGGDLYEAILMLRAYRSTQPRLAYAEVASAERMLTVRRISAAFKDIPGGQMLGPTLDYSHRLLRPELLDSPLSSSAEEVQAARPAPRAYPALADWQRLNGLLQPLEQREPQDPAERPDLTREPLVFPAPRAQRLQALARADTGGVLALGYASMRGYGLAHPTVNEIRLGYVELELRHPLTGQTFSAGRVRVSQAEIVNSFATGDARLGLGYAATLGWNEVKIIAGAMLDMEMDAATPHPAHTEDFVLYHTEPVESSGFCIHYKLPHYVTFSSALDNIRRIQTRREAGVPASEELELAEPIEEQEEVL